MVTSRLRLSSCVIRRRVIMIGRLSRLPGIIVIGLRRVVRLIGIVLNGGVRRLVGTRLFALSLCGTWDRVCLEGLWNVVVWRRWRRCGSRVARCVGGRLLSLRVRCWFRLVFCTLRNVDGGTMWKEIGDG